MANTNAMQPQLTFWGSPLAQLSQSERVSVSADAKNLSIFRNDG